MSENESLNNYLTNSGVVAEENGQQHKLPNQGHQGWHHPNDEEDSDLLDSTHYQQNIRKTIPEGKINSWFTKYFSPYQGKNAKRDMNSFFQTGPISLRISLMLLSFPWRLSTLVATHSLLVQFPT